MLSQAYLATKNGVFWGNAALNRAQQRDRSLIPLRVLGILDRVEKGTRNNHTASYRMRDLEGVKRALTEIGINPDANSLEISSTYTIKRRRASPSLVWLQLP